MSQVGTENNRTVVWIQKWKPSLITNSPFSSQPKKKTNRKQALWRKGQFQYRPGQTPGGLTLADDLWLGSSRDFRAPTPSVGSCVWKTDIRPPVGDISLNAAWSAGPKALWVSSVLVNICGNVFSKSWTSLWNKQEDSRMLKWNFFTIYHYLIQ